jgi:hypothetical protein
MTYTAGWAHRGVDLVFIVVAVMTLSLTAASYAGSAFAQSKGRAGSPMKGVALRTRNGSSKTIKVTHTPGRADRDVLDGLEARQRVVQSQIQTLIGATQQRADDLNRRMDAVTDQLQRLVFSQQQSSKTQQLLVATIRSTQRLLIIIIGLLLGICGGLCFLGLQLRHRGVELMPDRPKLIGTNIETPPDSAFEPSWKVGS